MREVQEACGEGWHVARGPPEQPVEGGIQLRELPCRPGRELSGVRRAGEGANRCSQHCVIDGASGAHNGACSSLVAFAWVVLGPRMSNVMPSILTVPGVRE